MTFRKRLRLYLTGFLMGVVLVIFFFNERLSLLTSWLPNERVLVRLQMTKALYEEEALCQLRCFDLDTSDVSILKKEGDVQFGMSKTHQEPKVYIVDHRLEDRLVRMTFAASDSTSELAKVELPFDNITCDCP